MLEVEILDALNQLGTFCVCVIFELEELNIANTDISLMISVIEAFAQRENESRSENIIMSIKHHVAAGTSKDYFEAMQIEEGRRSNIVNDENGISI